MAINEQLDTLYKLKKELEKSNNRPLINTINQVIKKVYLNQYTATIVGHFSAGKSTLINLLLEQIYYQVLQYQQRAIQLSFQ